MSQFLHLKDKFGNDVRFGNTGEVRVAPLPHIDDYSALLDRIRDVRLHPDDVIVVGFPKSGNNWTHHMASMLQAGTTDIPPMFGSNNFLFLEGSNDDLKLPPLDKPRVLLTHLPFRFLPRDVSEKKVKVVYVIRNPKDVFVSLWCHMSKVKFPLGYDGTWPQFFEVMLEQGFWYGDVFDYLKDWEKEISSHPGHPIYSCNFEDSKKDTVGQMEKLDQFLDTGRGRELCQAIVDTCQVDKMHLTRVQSDETFKDTWLWKDGVPSNSFYRKGMVGDWKNWFTVAQNEQFDQVYSTKMAGSTTTFVFE
ncbi:sulfotransferase 1A2-like [Littorina saxatilis]|uniref:Sulfotransferase domain-containing protein n=1 Tax=Littorina saxatilis TaxID=31220 RepID=A0AAN9BEC6_9CAEN